MMLDMKEIVELSRLYGEGKDFVIAGGGNTSVKDQKTVAVKASGVPLRGITEDGFVLLSRPAVRAVLTTRYDSEPFRREAGVKADLLAARVDPEKGGRPSVEVSLHEMIGHRLVVHTHPFEVNALLCSKNGEAEARALFGVDALFVPYTDPGYTLAASMFGALERWRAAHGGDPRIILMQNHGLVVAGDTAAEVRRTTDDVLGRIRARLASRPAPDAVPLEPDPAAASVLPGLRMILSPEDRVKVLSLRSSPLVSHFLEARNREKVSLPFTPDNIVYCGAAPLFADFKGDADAFLSSFPRLAADYEKRWGYPPRILLVGGLGMISVEDSARSAETCLDVFEDLMKVSAGSEAFGGPRFLAKRDMDFISTWEVESYRSSVAKMAPRRRLEGKIAVITGAGQGFGKGIAEGLFREGANVVIAELSEATGRAAAEDLNRGNPANRAFFAAVDVTDPESVQALAVKTAAAFGGLDILVSNAGVLRAGGLDELSEKDFDLVTRVNYYGFFHCVKHLSPIFMLQHRLRPGWFTDIIEINSKSGLEGSNRNFAYAGSKFGGIGLTQSFALELVEHRVKVNAVCPGNFFEGPLWSDPDKGLFVQYLRAGKVKGARTIADVKAHYESRVPMGRGCRVEDVMKAILYIIEQEYETGQAVPVTGGQVMMG